MKIFTKKGLSKARNLNSSFTLIFKLFSADTLIKTDIASCEVLDFAAHSSLLAVDPVKYVNKMPIDQMLP
uniref:Uncharacterized protein n=1 Tax=Arundo donax TaxID=35708 RepID=A0A0A9EA78_ARUDO